MGRPTTIMSVFKALINSPYYEANASTMPKSTTKSSDAASTSSAASLQRAPFSMPTHGPTALPRYRPHTNKGCATFATPATASVRPCHSSNLLGLLKFQCSKAFNSPHQACLCKARTAGAARISGQGINLVTPKST
eukprot:352239-Chlamydomonas_euryale.AAC.15